MNYGKLSICYLRYLLDLLRILKLRLGRQLLRVAIDYLMTTNKTSILHALGMLSVTFEGLINNRKHIHAHL